MARKIHTDVFIAGGGPAGSTAAITASSLGFNVIIAERKKFPRDKVCGDGVAFSSLKILSEYGISLEYWLNHGEFSHEKTIRILCSDQNILSIPNDYFFTLKRSSFDELLWNKIPESVFKCEESEITEIIAKEDNSYIIRLKNLTDEIEITAGCIIGADGYSSMVRRQFFPELNFQKRIAGRSYLLLPENSVTAYDFYFLPEIAPGYFWIFKTGRHYNCGVYVKDDFKGDLFALQSEITDKITGLKISKEDFKTWPIPNNSDFSSLCKNRVLLAGDAAGLCDVLLGQGIDAAILSGLLSVVSLNYLLKNGDTKYSLPEIYRYNLHKYLGETYRKSAYIYNAIKEKPEHCFSLLKEHYRDVIY